MEGQAASHSGQKRRYPPTKRRALIVEAATPLVMQQGLAETSMPQIADAAGVSLGTLSYHFKSRDELIREILATTIRDFYGPVERHLRETESALESLVYLATCHFEGEAWKQFLVWIDFWCRGAHNRELGSWISERFGWYETRVTQLVRRGVELGEFDETDGPRFARSLAALTNGYGVMMATSEGATTPSEVQEQLTDFVLVSLMGRHVSDTTSTG